MLFVNELNLPGDIAVGPYQRQLDIVTLGSGVDGVWSGLGSPWTGLLH
jgi:hypothetical protein